MVADEARLSPAMRNAITDPGNDLFLSIASAWEISIKYGLNRLALPEPPRRYMRHALDRSGVATLEISLSHATEVAELPPHHRDPFDRLIVAQARLESMVLATSDRGLSAYDVELVRA